MTSCRVPSAPSLGCSFFKSMIHIDSKQCTRLYDTALISGLKPGSWLVCLIPAPLGGKNLFPSFIGDQDLFPAEVLLCS